jgi:glucokinase
VEAFLDKGRMSAVLENVPVAVCLEPRAGLFGAATHAATVATTLAPKKPRPTR